MSDVKLTPFSFINAINDKVNVDLDTSQYVPFIVNRQLSYFKDTVLYANEMNMRPGIDKDQQFAFYVNGVSKRKRFAKWAKAEDDAKIQTLMQYYKINRRRAQEVSSLLNKEQYEYILGKMNKGGMS